MSEDDKPRGEPAVKAKIPNAKSIRSPEFTPHGISAGRGSGLNRPSALTAKQAKRRRIAAIAGAVVAVVAIAGGTTYYITRPDPAVSVTGAFGKAPKVEIPTEVAPPESLQSSTPIVGEGNKVAKGDTAFLQFVYYKWSPKDDPEDSKVKSTNEKAESTYESGAGVTPIKIGDSPVKGLDESLVGKTVGSRVVVEIPPEKGFGEQGQQLGITDKDSLLFVADIQASVPANAVPKGTEKKVSDKGLPTVEDKGAGKAPEVKMPDGDPPKELKAVTLVEGTGPALAKGDKAIMNYQGQLWRDGKVFDSSWETGQMQAFPIGEGATIPGFDKGLTGVKVGSRVMLVLPPKEGYGEQGNSQAGIKGDDTLVFVVDVLAKF
ncbi:FKBP-type peptidyl-prolyl cis-trans isomerase [Actinomadura algeriensis]|uniref:peptidylprolyl isomerase n=1 Tax=Actinomadura algeriensis TaxID=1679523 RepID=A0ABR9JJ97_9ACTN|nr:FKBP-type peptidyl-prolyl cis-trans isomerase [Actinomadura algeriensis]MBE1530593.1 peptidylprolyl isomerase [Actinomadura algeriensis]